MLIRDLIKDLENFKGDWVKNYKTITVRKKTTIIIINILILLTFVPIKAFNRQQRSYS